VSEWEEVRLRLAFRSWRRANRHSSLHARDLIFAKQITMQRAMRDRRIALEDVSPQEYVVPRVPRRQNKDSEREERQSEEPLLARHGTFTVQAYA
jgi:hypothetical protein